MKTILVILFIAFLVYRNAERLRRIQEKLNTPITYDDYLRKLCYIAEKSHSEIFKEAADRHNLPRYMVDRDFKRYLRDQTIPNYVEEFIDEGKEIIKNAEVNPFVFYR